MFIRGYRMYREATEQLSRQSAIFKQENE